MVKRLLLILLIALAGNTAIAGQEKEAPQAQSIPKDMPTVSLCELALHPSRFDKKIVRVRAILVTNHAPRVDGGDPFLFDPSCYSYDTMLNTTWQRAALSDAHILKVFKDTDRKRDKYENDRVEVTAIGQYDAPNGIGYGHLGWARSQLTILQYEKAEPVADSVPWHWEMKPQPALARQAEEQIRVIDLWLQAYIMGERAKAADVRPTLTEGYVLVSEENVIRGWKQMATLPVPVQPGKESSVRIKTLQIYGETAIVAGISKRCTQAGDCQSFSYMNTYVKRNNTWQAVASHLVPVK
jgi:hypothetical protein